MSDARDLHPSLAPFGGSAPVSPERPAGAEGSSDPAIPGMASGGDASESTPAEARDWVPTLELPTGGGSVQGIGEKFEANAFTGSGSLSVPLALSPGRGGFGPALSLAYASGAGNGPFGVGWSLGVPSIRRKTDQQLPRYEDGRQSDTFVLAGAEDLVPLLDGSGQRVVLEHVDHLVHLYRPRVEGGFARIERWVRSSDGQTHWRVIDRNNVTSWLGRDAASRVTDPEEPSRVFEWLLEEVRDDRGNVARYEYKPEDAHVTGTGSVFENNRAPTAGQYLKRIVYGNRVADVADDWAFEVVLDYGEHGTVDAGTEEVFVTPAEDRAWPLRSDPFSSFRAGFDVRTRRRCQRVLMFHRFDELGPEPTLVRSVDLGYDEASHLAKLVMITARSYERNPGTGGYVAVDFPPVELEYTSDSIAPRWGTLEQESMDDLPEGIDGQRYRLADVDGEGLPGVLTQQAGALYYKAPRGQGRFGKLQVLGEQPSTARLGEGALLTDVDGDGRLELVSRTASAGSYARRASGGGWESFVAFEQVPSIDWGDPQLRELDLDGDGRADVLIARDDYFIWYPSRGQAGYGEPCIVPKPSDEQEGPAIVFSDGRGSIVLGDMTGDGLRDIVRVENGAVHYWPNLGHGRFGRRVTMDGAPVFAAPDLFSPSRLRLADVDGSGTADLVYLDQDGARLWLNRSGNGFSPPVELTGFPGVDGATAVEVYDLLGQGTACLLWSTGSSWARPHAVQYLELLPQKPHLLRSVVNNMGLEIRLEYEASTTQYLRDVEAGRPWITRLPFPTHVVTRVEHYDAIARRRTVQRYAYHHGYYDGLEREMRGFAMVERWDTESFEDFNHPGLFSLELFDTVESNLHQPPVLTRTWFHTGAFLGRERISRLLAEEYWDGDPLAPTLADTVLPADLSAGQSAEACRALRGTTLRSEVYALDGSPEQDLPYTVSEQNFAIRRLQPRGHNEYAVFHPHEREAITLQYERDPAAPRLSHALTLDVDDYGNVTRSASVAYPARSPDPSVPEQADSAVLVSEASFALVDEPTISPDVYRIGVPVEERSFELHGLGVTANALVDLDALRDAIVAAPRIPPESTPAVGDLRLLSAMRSLYYADDLLSSLPLGQCGTRALPYESREAAVSEGRMLAVFAAELPSIPLDTDGGYVLDEGLWWARSGRQRPVAAFFYQPDAGFDPFDHLTTIEWDPHRLFVRRVVDPLGNAIEASFDYRVLAPFRITDANLNRTEVGFDTRGMVVWQAVMGKAGAGEGDTPADPTATFEYDLFAWRDLGAPLVARSRVREIHGDPATRWLERISYIDGSGRVILDKVGAAPGLAPQRDASGQLVLDPQGEPILVPADPRWTGSGRLVLDNKGNPVKQYEPYFSSTDAYEDEVELRERGVTPILHYDPLGRLVRTDFPDGTFSRVDFDPWRQTSYDPNDTAGESTWHSDRVSLPGGDPERRAAEVTVAHHDTPTVVHLDHLGRPVRVVAHNRRAGGGDQLQLTRTVLDVQGNPLLVFDARGNEAEARVYGMHGQVLQVSSVDGGTRRSISNILGVPLRAYDDRGHVFRMQFDALWRPTHEFVQPEVGPERLVTRTVYGESLPSPQDDNLRGRPYRVYDSAGVVTTVEVDFKGATLRSERRLAVDYTTTPDWSALAALTDPVAIDTAAAPDLEAEVFVTESTWDAIGRPLTQTSPDGTVTLLGYDAGGLLRSVQAEVRGAQPATDFVVDIDYDVRGRREAIVYGNGTTTTYTYDDLTLRLRRLHTTRSSDGAAVQDLRYVYDPVGNIVEIDDLAQQTVFFANALVSPRQRFEYDATYQLAVAEGREHTSQGQPTSSELTPGPLPDPNDPAALRSWVETYLHDPVGNLTQVQHVAAGGSWTRAYEYDAAGNRLLATSAPGDPLAGPYSHTYAYDAHGNMTAMPHLAAVDWDHADRMQHADLGGGGDVWFVYDSAGRRVRKVRVNQAGTQSEERIYLGGVELYRERQGAALQLERETLHIADDTGRIAMVETLTVDGGAPVVAPANLARYQYSNHLGSASLELDEAANTISYEEYHPYGTSSYRSVDASVQVSAKRYRYIGMERDEETGLDHMGARYYAPWLGRWTSGDPIGLGDGVNRYAYVSNNPVRMRDPTGTKGTPASEQEQAAQRQSRARQEEAEAQGSTDTTQAYRASPRDPAAIRAERRAAKRAVREAEVLDATVNMAVAQYEALLRAEDAHRVEELEKIADRLGYYPTGRVVSYFEPGQEGPQRVADFRDALRGTLRRTEGQPFDDRVAALQKVNEKALAGIDWRADAATDIALFDAAFTLGAGVAGRGLGQFGPSMSGPAPRGGGGWLSRKLRNLTLGVRLRFGRPGPPPGKTTLYHQGHLGDGVDTSRTFSTSTSPELEHYRPDGRLYRFEVDNAVIERGKAQGTIQQGYDNHEATGTVSPETRFLPNSVTQEELGRPVLVPKPPRRE
ncbi:MAG: SpvB/TcaC N-terminal domain-containing protein [Myxococcota bacterium]